MRLEDFAKKFYFCVMNDPEHNRLFLKKVKKLASFYGFVDDNGKLKEGNEKEFYALIIVHLRSSKFSNYKDRRIGLLEKELKRLWCASLVQELYFEKYHKSEPLNKRGSPVVYVLTEKERESLKTILDKEYKRRRKSKKKKVCKENKISIEEKRAQLLENFARMNNLV